MSTRTIRTVLRAEFGQYQQAMKDAAKATEELGKAQDKNSKSSSKSADQSARDAQKIKDNWRTVGTSMIAVGTAMTGLTAAVLKTGISYNTLQQTSRAALTTLLGGAEQANAQMDKLDEFARTSPFSKATFISAQQQMLAFGIEARKVVPYLDAIQNAVAAAGGSNADIAGIVATMAKIQSSAKLTAQDLNEFGNRGVNAAELIGSQMGMTGAEIRTSITSGSLDATQALDALAAGMSKRFDGAADNVKNTFVGALDRAKAAVRDLSSSLAEPLVGKEGGGLATAALNQVADSLRAFEDLPTPIRNTGAAMVGLAGAGSLAAGSFLLFAPRIIETREAMKTLHTTMPRTVGAVDKLNKAAGAAALTMTALTVAAQLAPDKVIASSESMRRAILDLAAGADTASVSMDMAFTATGSSLTSIGSLQEALETVNYNGFIKALDFVGSGFGIFDTEVGLARDAIAGFDAELAALVSEGYLDEAAAGAAKFIKAARDAGSSTPEAAGFLSKYNDALAGVDNNQRLTAESARSLKEQLGELTEEYREAANAVADQREAEIDYLDTLDSVREKIEEGGRVARDSSGAVDEHASATRRADEALIGLSRSAAKVIGGMIELDASGKEIADTAAKQREQFIRVAETYGYTAGEAKKLADQYGLIPEQAVTDLIAKDQASSVINQVQGLLNKLPFTRDITVRTQYVSGGGGRLTGSATGGRVPLGFSGGGKVPGTPPATPWVDNVIAKGANSGATMLVRSGEWIINEPQSKKNDKWLRAINSGLDLNQVFGAAPSYVGGGRMDYDQFHNASHSRPGGGPTAGQSIFPTQFDIQITNWATGEGRMTAIANGAASAHVRSAARFDASERRRRGR